MFGRIDTDKSGEIEFSEFLAATINKQKLLSEERLKIAFDMYDIDKSGSITTEEIGKVLGKYKSISEEVVYKIMKEADFFDNGVVTFPEFKIFMSKLCEIQIQPQDMD